MSAAKIKHIRHGSPLYTVNNKALHGLDNRLFGHFMERPIWGEIGIEAGVVSETHQLQPRVRELLEELHMPIVRFPGGTDVDYMDWRDMVSNVPGRGEHRPLSTGHKGHSVSNYFGFDEFLRLCAQLKAEPIIVVNLGDALMKKMEPGEAATVHAAALVAYCNAPLDADLPEGISDWPAVRARNGHPEPYHVPYFQIGNETWGFFNKFKKEGTPDGEVMQHHVDCLAEYVRAMRSVDPSIQILLDVINEELAARIKQELGDLVQYMVQHRYAPWKVQPVEESGQPYPVDRLTQEEVWNAWVAVPNTLNADGESVITGDAAITAARKVGYNVAVTEWNWAGWWKGEDLPLNSLLAKGVGAAGILHSFMRSGDIIKIGCQSMTVGQAGPRPKRSFPSRCSRRLSARRPTHILTNTWARGTRSVTRVAAWRIVCVLWCPDNSLQQEGPVLHSAGLFSFFSDDDSILIHCYSGTMKASLRAPIVATAGPCGASPASSDGSDKWTFKTLMRKPGRMSNAWLAVRSRIGCPVFIVEHASTTPSQLDGPCLA